MEASFKNILSTVDMFKEKFEPKFLKFGYNKKGTSNLQSIHDNWKFAREMLSSYANHELAPFEEVEFKPIIEE